MPKKQKPVKFYTQSFNTAGEIVNNGETIKMEDGSVFKRTVIPSLFGKAKPLDPDIADLDEIDQGTSVSEGDFEDFD